MKRALLFVVPLLLAGCATRPEDRLVGAWSLDPVRTEIPSIPFPGMEDRIRTATRNMRLKLRSDQTFVLAGGRVTEGTWQLRDGDVKLKPKDPEVAGFLESTGGILTAKIARDRRSLTLEQETPVGAVRLVLKKTG